MLKKLIFLFFLCVVSFGLSGMCSLCLGKEQDVTACKPAKQRYYDDRERGWFFKEYCEPLKPEGKRKPKDHKHEDSEPPELTDWAKLRIPRIWTLWTRLPSGNYLKRRKVTLSTIRPKRKCWFISGFRTI